MNKHRKNKKTKKTKQETTESFIVEKNVENKIIDNNNALLSDNDTEKKMFSSDNFTSNIADNTVSSNADNSATNTNSKTDINTDNKISIKPKNSPAVFSPITKKEEKKTKKKEKEIKPPPEPPSRYNEFVLMDDFIEAIQDKNPIKVIDGQLCVYQYGEYKPFNNSLELEALIYKETKSQLKEQGSRSLIKKCADLINLEAYCANSEVSCEKNGLVAIRNCVIDSNTLNLYPVSPAINITYTLDISCIQTSANEQTPVWDNFLACIANGNQMIINRIYEMIGYLLMPDNKAKVFFLLQGVPNSGKSILGNFIKSYFPDYKVTYLDIERLGDRYSTSSLQNSCLNISMDLPNRQLPAKALAVLKQLTGGDGVTLESKYHNITKYYGQCKLLFGTNHPIKLLERDDALEDRIICIPFLNSIPKYKQDNDLLAKLFSERDTIAARAIFYYYPNLKAKNYIFAGTGESYMKPEIIYKIQSDMKYENIRHFIKARCDLVPFDIGKTHTINLYEAYTLFCKDLNYQVVDAKSFAQRLSKILQGKIQHSKWRNPKTGYNGNGFEGIMLKAVYSTDYLEDDYPEDDCFSNEEPLSQDNTKPDTYVKPLFPFME